MITFLKKPQKFTPSGNPVVFQIRTDNPNILYFSVQLVDDASASVINTLQVMPTPASPMGAYVDASRLLDSVVFWEVNNDPFQLVTPIQKVVRSYRLTVKEKVISAGAVVDGDSYDVSSDKFYVFNSELDRFSFNQYLQVKYVTTANTTASFLTTKPNQSYVNQFSAEMLYFIQDGTVASLSARVRTYDNSGTLVDTINTPIQQVDQFQMFRLNVSPKALISSNNLDFSSVQYYVVDIIDANNNARSEERVFQYREADCGYEYVNLLWVNQLGGVDSYSFLSPIETVNYSKFTIKKNIYSINSDGLYSDQDNGVFNQSEAIINNTPTTTTKVISQPLKDLEAFWLQGLFQSKQVFVEFSDGSLVPVMLTTDSYQVPRTRYTLGSPSTTSVEFTLASGIIPTGAHAYGTKANNISFIDSQMNTLQLNLPGYDISQNPPHPHQYSGQDYTDKYEI